MGSVDAHFLHLGIGDSVECRVGCIDVGGGQCNNELMVVVNASMELMVEASVDGSNDYGLMCLLPIFLSLPYFEILCSLVQVKEAQNHAY